MDAFGFVACDKALGRWRCKGGRMTKVTEADTPLDAGSAFNVVAQAERAADTAARRAGVTLGEVEDMPGLRMVSGLFESVWGRTPEGVPVSSEVLRSLVHAGGCVTTALDQRGELLGAAALTLAEPAGSTYSLIAAVSPGATDGGVGRAVKLRQRAWALRRGYTSMAWTFDPLVSRNARFNLAKLGAVARQYAVGFYGEMSDRINGADEADRLVATWVLDSRRVVAASEGTAADPAGPAQDASALTGGPDGDPITRLDATGLWVRVPTDIVALRGTDRAAAERWRAAARSALVDAFEQSRTATHMTRHGWYLLEEENAR